MNGSEWALKMQPDIYWSKHMVTFEQQHLEKIEKISGNGEKSKTEWSGPVLDWVNADSCCKALHVDTRVKVFSHQGSGPDLSLLDLRVHFTWLVWTQVFRAWAHFANHARVPLRRSSRPWFMCIWAWSVIWKQACPKKEVGHYVIGCIRALPFFSRCTAVVA